MNGIVTISGECRDEASRSVCEEIAGATDGVKTVINNVTFPGMYSDTTANAAITAAPVTDTAMAAAPVTITAIEPLVELVATTLEKYPTVKAAIKERMITLTGEIRKNELPVLMSELHALKPTKIEQKLTIIQSREGKKNHVKSTKAKRGSLKQPKTKKKSRRH